MLSLVFLALGIIDSKSNNQYNYNQQIKFVQIYQLLREEQKNGQRLCGCIKKNCGKYWRS